ncbi:TRAP transporter substrate-binding protein [Wenyingzhuangia sp. 1_MG-2023]|nr:TRAP transporter substrate-binding protein [Wenyingzhuangia sp. 1_MG-2023]
MTGCTSKKQSVKTIKIAHGLDVSHSVHKAMLVIGKELDSLSNGQMHIKIYPNQQLGTERQCLELLQAGSLDMTKVSVAVLENFTPKMKVLGLPYLFRNKHHTFEVLDGKIGKELLDATEAYWLKGLAYYDAGSRSFYTQKPINTPKDLIGLKIRVMESASAMSMVKALGGSPTPISSGELYTAIQQGVVDGAENNPPTFYLSRHYEVCKYYTLDEHTMIPDVLMASTYMWNKLSKQEQKWMQLAIQKSVAYQRTAWEKAETEALEKIKEHGVKIIYPDTSKFIEKTKNIYKLYKKDTTLNRFIHAIQK